MVLVTIPVLAWTGHLQVYVLYITALLAGGLSALFGITYGAYLPSVVPAGQLAAGNRRMQGTESLSQVVGPSVGGLLVTALGAPFAVLVDAGSFLFSAGFNFAIGALTPAAALIPFSMLWFVRSPLPHLRTVEPAAAAD